MKDLLFIKIHFLQLKIIFGLFFQIFECSRQSRIFSHVWIFKPDTEHFWRKINFLNCAGKLQTRYIDVEQQDAKIFLFFLCHTVCRAVTVIWGQPSKKLPQIHLCTIDCVQSTLQNCSSDCVFPVLLQKLRWCYWRATQQTKKKRSIACVSFCCAASCLDDRQKQAGLLLFLLSPFGRTKKLLSYPRDYKKGFSRPWNCSLFRSIKLKSFNHLCHFLLRCTNL